MDASVLNGEAAKSPEVDGAMLIFIAEKNKNSLKSDGNNRDSTDKIEAQGIDGYPIPFLSPYAVVQAGGWRLEARNRLMLYCAQGFVSAIAGTVFST